MKRTLLLCVIGTLLAYSAAAQRIDTVRLENIRANLPIIGKTADLQFINKRQAKWYYYYHSRFQYPRFRIIDSTRYRCIERYNHINLITIPYQVQYVEENGDIRLHYLDFKKRKGSIMFLWEPNISLSYKTTLEEFLKAFNEPEFPESGIASMAPYNYKLKHWRKKYYVLGYYTGENKYTCIVFYFDHKQHLRFVEIEYYNKNTVQYEEK